MKVTIQQIADKAGVSRGTVDRALNNRGRIAPDVAEKIKSIAEELGYTPAIRKKSEIRKKKIKIGIINQLAKSSFMLEVNKGIQQAKEELAEWGIEIIVKEVFSVDEKIQLKYIEELAEIGIDGLAIMPVNCESIRLKLNWLIEQKKVPVVTFNSDIVGTKRCCFVGMDNQKSGQTAAGLMNMLTGGVGKILIITGFFSNSVNNARVDGFIEEIKKNYTQLSIAGVQASFDEAEEVEHIIENTIKDVSGVNGIFVVSGGQSGIAKAFEKLNIEKRPHVIIYDKTPKNEKILIDNVADFLIDQNSYIQGYRPPYILANILGKGQRPKSEFLYTDINIKTKYNL